MVAALLALPFVAELAAAAALALALLAEWLHARRVRRVALLAFGPARRPGALGRAAPALRVLAAAALAWGLVSLLLVAPKLHSPGGGQALRRDSKHVLLALDVSPSMRLVDAGPEHDQSRMARAQAVLGSFFQRIPIDEYRVSVVAVYNGAKPVVIDTRDMDVVDNVLGDLPMHYAFPAGKTRLFDGLEEAAKLAKDWEPWSTTLLVVSDGDTVPATGMPRMPASVASVLVVGVGDPVTGKFIDGRQSRQDSSTLRQLAARLGGAFHDANAKHLPSSLVADITAFGAESPFAAFTRREYALICIALGSALLALLPLLLHYFGTGWRPGARAAGRGAIAPRAFTAAAVSSGRSIAPANARRARGKG